MATYLIHTENTHPPIPINTHDWCAFLEGNDLTAGVYGWGASEAEAVRDLFLQLGER